MKHPIERIRDAFARAHARIAGDITGKVSTHYMTIPPDPERDVDLILTDAIDELDALRARVAELERAVERRQSEVDTLLRRIGQINASDRSLNGEHRRRLLAEIEVNMAVIRALRRGEEDK